MMRSAARAAGFAALLFEGSMAAAADGQMGASSSASITIRASVAPRAWSAANHTLCVAGPPTGYSLRLDEGSPALSWAEEPGGNCAFHATQLKLVDAAGSGSAMLLVVPE